MAAALAIVFFCGGNEERHDLQHLYHWGPECISDLCGSLLSNCGSHSIICSTMVFQTETVWGIQCFYIAPIGTVFSSPLAINISWLFEKKVLPCAYLCVDLWGIRNCRADLFGWLFKGKGEFMFPPPTYLFCATYSAAQTNTAYSVFQERLVPQSWNQGRLYFKPFFPSPPPPHYPSTSSFF